MADSQAFFQRLQQLGVSSQDILDHGDLPPNSGVVGYTSQIDGFGTKESDLDIYVYSPAIHEYRVETISLGSVVADIEYVPLSFLQTLVQRLENLDLDNPETQRDILGYGLLKQLYRLTVGARLRETEEFSSLCQRISPDRLKAALIRLHRHAADDAVEDAIRMFESGDYLSAMHVGRKAFDQTALAYLALRGTLVFKVKWTYRALMQTLGPDHWLSQAFIHYHFAVSPAAAKEAAANMIRDWERILADLP